jgi:hypothetical protein
MIKKRAESYVREQHVCMVTPEHLDILVKRRFGSAGPPGKPDTGKITGLADKKISGAQT